MSDDLFSRISKYKADHMRDGPDDPLSGDVDSDVFNKSFFNFEKAKISYNKRMQARKEEPSELDREFDKTMQRARERAKQAPKTIDRRMQARRELNSKIVHKDNSVIQMTALDAHQLSDLVDVLHPLNDDALRITGDLDHDLTNLYDNDKDQYSEVIRKGEMVLNRFDHRAKKFDVKTPKRMISQRLDDDAHQKINDLPDFGNGDSVSLNDSYSSSF